MIPRGRYQSHRKAVRDAARELLARTNVTHVTIGEKIASEQGTGRIALKAHVRAKEPVGGKEGIPARLDGAAAGGNSQSFITDVVATGNKPSVFGMRSGDRIMAFDRDVGLVGFVFDKNDRRYGLTNAHVVCAIDRDGRSGPARWFDAPSIPPPIVGDVAIWTPLRRDQVAKSDAAAVHIDDRRLGDPYRVRGIDEPIAHSGIIRSDLAPFWLAVGGELYRCDRPEPVVGETPVRVDGVVIHYAGFWQLTVEGGVARKGISGGILLRRTAKGLVACGLVFGGVEPNFVWAYSFQPLFDRLFAALPP